MKSTQLCLYAWSFVSCCLTIKAATYTVTTTNVIGAGTLRQAIEDANASPGADTVAFSLPANSGFIISPTNALPAITDPLTLNGFVQPGQVIELNGQSAGTGTDGLKIMTSNCIIIGMAINRFNGDGIEISGGQSNVVDSCYIGLARDGITVRANNLSGVFITNAPNNELWRNIIAGNNQYGVHIGGANATGNLLEQNFIGLDVASARKANGQDGVRLNAPSNRIGQAGNLGNVISGNNSDGIEIANPGSSNNVITGNAIGMSDYYFLADLSGALARGNSGDGIMINGASGNVISNNLIAANSGDGVEINGANAFLNVLVTNRIGVLSGTALGNTAHGVNLANNARTNRIGGVVGGEGNTIAFNGQDGVFAGSGTNNTIRGNSIFANGELGIDIGNNGVTANDIADADSGANQLQNFPVLAAATNSAGGVVVVGTLNSRPSNSYLVDLYASTAFEPTGNGEGQTYLGTAAVNTDGSGNAAFNVTLPGLLSGRYVTATATDPLGNTSEFCPSIAAASTLAPQTFTVINTNNSGTGSLRQAILDANAYAGNGADTISFNIPGAGPHTNRPASALPAITDSVVLDGFTQPGSSANTLTNGSDAVWRIVLDGAGAGSGVDGIAIQASNCVVRGLCIIRFNNDGVELSTNGNSRVEGCLIGLGLDGADQGNNANGINLNNSPNNEIGGVTFLARNIISGNNGHGIAISGGNSFSNRVLNNLIGTGLGGTIDVGNSQDGINVSTAGNTIIGDAGAYVPNIISGNNGDGIELTGAATTGTLIFGNLIGTDYFGTFALGNSQMGVNVSGNARSNVIGDGVTFHGNRIAFNGNIGVALASGTNNLVRANLIYSNVNLGIDLGNAGRTANDSGDPDTGANNLQNFPVLTNAILRTTDTVIEGSLNSRPNTAYVLEFYANEFGDASGNGEGQIFLGATNATTGADSNANFSVSLPAAPNARFITATATDPAGNTSEFSPHVRASSELTPATFTVVNADNSGFGSLRSAIERVNARPVDSPHRIDFDIPGPDPHVISVLSALPSLLEPVIIDGYSQPGAAANSQSNGNNAVLKIRLDGAGASGTVDGLRIIGATAATTIRGISITRFTGDGIEISTNGNCRIEGCFIGLDLDGVTAAGNAGSGLTLVNSPRNIIGGQTAATRNVISGNGQHGLSISGAGSMMNLIAANFIGTTYTGTQNIANAQDGLNLNNAPLNSVGSVSGWGNVISGNGGNGIQVTGATATNNSIVGNFIGPDYSGTAAIVNGGNGVLFNSNARFNNVGFPASGAENFIAYNNGAGVNISGGTNNVVRANRITANGGIGIDLAGNDITSNDIGDTDNGPNLLQNFPLLTAGTITTSNTTVQGTLNTRSNSMYFIDVFANSVCDNSGNGEGQQYLGSTTVTTDAAGNGAFNITLPAVALGRFLTATATDTNGNTSEFSPCLRAVSTFAPTALTVINTNDSGAGSLRQALLDANNFPSEAPHRITFNIPGAGPHIIAPLSRLPTNSEPVFVDGYSQPGAISNSLPEAFNALLKIRIDGINGISQWRLAASSNVIRGIAFTRYNFSNPLEFMPGSDGNRVGGCLFGINIDGSQARVFTCITIDNGAHNEIGGLFPADRNVFAYNFGNAVTINGGRASNNIVRGNLIGTDFTGLLPGYGNSTGVEIDGGSFNTIGGTEPGARNVIASGSQRGIRIQSNLAPARGNFIQGNYIGTDITGNNARANGSDGIGVFGFDTLIGGATPGARNIIGANGQFGIDLAPGTSGNVVLGNWIGRGVNGGMLTNVAAGIAVSGNSNRIGGIIPGEGNVIVNNRNYGVYLAAGTQNRVRGNSIYNNQSPFPPTLGIDISGDGITANDAGDADAGPNNRQNFPVITSASGSASSITMAGTFNSMPGQAFDLDFYASQACDPSGNGEGEQHLGSTTVTTDGAGNASFNVTLPAIPLGRYMTATATDSNGNTSEFSPCYEALLGTLPMTFTVTTTNDAGPGSLRQAILDSNAHAASTNNTIAFNIPGPGVRAIRLASPLPPFTQPVTIDGFTQPGAGANTHSNGNNAVWLVELRGIGSNFNEITLTLNIGRLVVRGLRIAHGAGTAIDILSSNCVVAGCFIYSNTAGGINITGANGNRIGGSAPADRNVISGHGGSRAIEIFSGNNNVIVGNIIGPDSNGGSTFGSQFQGVSLFNSSANVIGDGTPGGANFIAFHTSGGVSIQSGTNNSVRGNRMYSNGTSSLDLGSDGQTQNDPGDMDVGANNLQNHPVITNVIANASTTVLRGRFNSQPNTVYTLDAYASSACNVFGSGDAESYLGSAVIMTDGTGNVSFDVSVPSRITARNISATATDPNGNTSEISPCVQPTTVTIPPAVFVVLNTNDIGPGSLRQAMIDALSLPNVGADAIHFNIPGTGPHTIRPITELPLWDSPLVIDGYTQPGAVENTSSNANNAVLKIEIDGTALPAPNRLLGVPSLSTVRGISFRTTVGAVLGLQGTNIVVEGNWFGINPNGQATTAGTAGISVFGATNRIGGSAASQRNVIVRSGRGVLLQGPGNIVQGNFIGVGLSGTNGLGNAAPGVEIRSTGCIVGGTNEGTANLICFNQVGVAIFGGYSNWVAGNFIGTDGEGTNEMGNLQDGVQISGSSSNLIGGDALEADNAIAFNAGDGVAINSGRQNAVIGNTIDFNSMLPVDLGFSANDGAATPVLGVAFTGSTVVRGTHAGLPNTTYRIDVTARVHPPGATRRARRKVNRVGSFTITTDSQGRASFEHTFPQTFPDFAQIQMQAHCENNSSELTPPQQLVPGGTANLGVTMTTPSFAQLGSNYVITVFVTNRGPATATNAVLTTAIRNPLLVNGVLNSNLNSTVQDGVVTVNLGSLPPGTGTRVDISVTGVHARESVITADVSSQTRDYNTGDNHINEYVRVSTSFNSIADLSVTFPEMQDPLSTFHNVGNRVAVRVVNLGPTNAVNVRLRIALRPGDAVSNIIESISASLGTPQIINNAVAEWTMPLMAPGQVVDVILYANWLGSTPGTDLRQYVEAIVYSDTYDPRIRNNKAMAEALVRVPGLMNEIHSGGAVYNATWAAPTPGTLEFSTNLINWLPYPSNQVNASNGTYSISVSLGTSPKEQFFRLRYPEPEYPTVNLFQQSLDVNNLLIPDSDWGRLNLRFVGQPGVQYFNLNFGGDWVIQNIPIIAHDGIGAVQDMSFSFPLGTYYAPLYDGPGGFSLTPNVLDTMPPATGDFPIIPEFAALRPGELNELLLFAPAAPLIGGTPFNIVFSQPVFPNREQGENECVPAAIVNSLEYLNNRYFLGMDTNKITLDKIKQATGWTTNGAPVGADFVHPEWGVGKSNYLASENLPIATEMTIDPAKVVDALSRSCDVEVRVTGHCAVLRGMHWMGGTRYLMVISHDAKQGEVGGTIMETIFLDTSNGKISGGPWTHNSYLRGFVIECPVF